MKKDNNFFILILGCLLLCYGLFGNKININPNPNNPTPSAPTIQSLKDSSLKIVECLRNGSSDRSSDGINLSNLYSDLAKLTALDSTNEVIKNTDEIRDANRIAGLLYDLNLKNKYPGLAEAADNLFKTHIGNDNVSLDPALRTKAVESFNALAWAFYEGSK